MPTTTKLEKREVKLTELPLNEDVTLVQMPDLTTFDFHVQSDKHYIVHFLNPEVFGQEFATIRKGYNLFTQVKTEETMCFLHDDVEMRNSLADVESKTDPEPIPPKTDPEPIPPKK
jgi:hypothetical protein